jgi:predicted aminopeptidase
MQAGLKALVAALLALLLTGCDSLSYYRQAIVGQLSLLQQRQDIATVLQDPALPAPTRHQLALVLELRQFADQQLHLPANKHYSTYVDLHREFVVWNVFAAPEFSLTPEQWCYPVAGCAGYRGYFAESDAKEFAARLQQQGFDTYVGGVSAYSTLGWFNDPVPSSMLRRDDAQLAGTLFHELAHQLLYVSGDTAFNESFATLVEQEGQQRWLHTVPDASGQQQTLAAVLASRQQQQQFVALVLQTAGELSRLYQQKLPVADMRSRKAEIQTALRRQYQELKLAWNGYNGYDRWFAADLNNAQLATVTTYNQWVPALQELLRRQNGDLPRFYEAARQLSRLSSTERERQLRELLLAQ